MEGKLTISITKYYNGYGGTLYALRGILQCGNDSIALSYNGGLTNKEAIKSVVAKLQGQLVPVVFDGAEEILINEFNVYKS